MKYSIWLDRNVDPDDMRISGRSILRGEGLIEYFRRGFFEYLRSFISALSQ